MGGLKEFGYDVAGLVDTRAQRQRSVRSGIAVASMVATVALAAHALRHETRKSFVSPYKASAYWVSYADGFVRRGLVGELLSLLTNGSPTRIHAVGLAAGLLVATTAALIFLIGRIARTVRHGDDRILVIAVMSASPFTFALLVHEIGRYDSIGILAMAALAALARTGETSGVTRLARAGAICALVAVGTAGEELLFAFLAPLAVLGLRQLGWTEATRLAPVSALVTMPGAILAAMSVLLRPSRETLVAAINKANAAGVSVDVVDENCISTLGQSAVQGLQFTRNMSAWTVLSCAALFGGCYLLATVIIRRLVRPDRLVWVLITVFGVAALGLSAVGDDYGRWWALAFVAVLAGLAILGGPATIDVVERAGASRLVWVLLACAVLAFSVRLQLLNVWPDWDPTADTGFSVNRLTQLDPHWR